MNRAESQEFMRHARNTEAKTKSSCRQLLDLVDVYGENRAFEIAGNELNLSVPLMRRMIIAANGCEVVELFLIARDIARAMDAGER